MPLKKLFFFLSCLLAFFLSLTLFSADLKVYYINVGQGDSTYIEFPDGKNMLIDGGPSYTEDIRNPVIGFLKAKEINKINYMLLSHPHSDHVNGLYAVLKTFNVEKVYDTGVDNGKVKWDDEFRSIAQSVPGRYTIVDSTGLLLGFSVSSVTITVLHTSTVPQSDINNNSIVIKIQFSSSTFFFGGDATGEIVESKLVSWHGTGI
ncbi:MAG: MBL fold metallo-hydrolase, partial [Elusimicrobiota bacterium]|nr:MBL fold metallo-hydrolase [Elusimicrobiota bacterium]